MEFTGKVALITGGGGGIGRATAIGFAGRGAKVVVVDLDPTAGEASAELVRQRGGDARFVRADVTKSADVQNYVKATLDAYGAIDCFFNNAGIEGKFAPTQEYDEAIFDAVIGVNLKGVFLGMRHVLPVMLQQGRGAIVNTASVAGLFGGPGMAPYVASKHGVLGLTKVASADVARLGVQGERRVSGAGRDAHDALARGAAESCRSAGGARCKRRQHTDRALRDAGGSGERGDVSVLGLRQRHHRNAHRHRRRAFRIGRRAVSPATLTDAVRPV